MTTLETREASPDLKAAVRGLIADQMAEALSGADINLRDDAAVVAALSAAGFGARTIRPLYAEARARVLRAWDRAPGRGWPNVPFRADNRAACGR